MSINFFFISIVLFLSLRVFSQHIPKKDEVSITYSGFTHHAYPYNDMNTILLKIENHTDDTLYLFELSIIMDVYKHQGKTKLESCVEIGEREYKEGRGIFDNFFIEDKPTKTFAEQQMERDRDSLLLSLKRKYVEKLLAERNIRTSEWWMNNPPFIVLMPMATVIYEVIYCDSRFDRTCRVYPKYERKKLIEILSPK